MSAVDPSASFVASLRERQPGVDVQQAGAERLPFPDNSFEAALAQLVVHFMSDPVAGLVEMARVTRRGGIVAACVWDHAGGQGPLSLFWTVGPAGAYVVSLSQEEQVALRERCRDALPAAPFVLTARAWAARGLV